PVYKSPCALTLHAISHYSPDVLKAHAGVALPLAFLGMHQAPGPDEEKGESHDATLWSEVWQENVPAAMATVAKEQTGSLVAPHLGLVLTALMQGLSGRTWAGKVSVALIILDQTQPWIQLFFWFRSGGAVESHRISGVQVQILTEACTALTYPLGKEGIQKWLALIEGLMFLVFTESIRFIFSTENKSYSSVRTEALSVVDLMVKRTGESEQWDCMPARSREQLQRSLSTLQSDSRPELREKAQELRRRIQSQP
ncbi:hypothetical protein GOODEAATRI_005777, partial [Goodea atripinnis]